MKSQWKVCTEYANNNITKLIVSNDCCVQGPANYSIDVERINDHTYEFFCNEPRWKMLNNKMKYKNSDILIGSFPKCGTTWLEQIVLLLLNDGSRDVMDPSVKNSYHKDSSSICKIWPEAALLQDPDIQNHIGKQATPISIEEFESIPSPRVMKTHASVDMFLGSNGRGLADLPNGAKMLLITRNPFDACVSSYFYGHNAHRNGWPFEAWAALFLSGLAAQGDWFEWVRGWSEQARAYPERTLWIHYEELKRDTRNQVKRIAEFIGIRRGSAEDMDALIDRVVEHSAFDSMTEQAAERQPVDGFHDRHLRKGQSGDWRNYFDIDSGIYKDFVAKFNAVLSGSGLVYSLGDGNGYLSASEVNDPK